MPVINYWCVLGYVLHANHAPFSPNVCGVHLSTPTLMGNAQDRYKHRCLHQTCCWEISGKECSNELLTDR